MADLDLSGYYFIDGMDIWTAFSMFVEEGSDDFLKYAAKKDSITHDWLDSDGLDVDLSRIFFAARDITLKCAIIANSESDFWSKYNLFLKLMKQPGQRRIAVTEFGFRSFNVFYKECNNWQRFTRILNSNKVANKFTIVFTENEPSPDSSDEFIVDEDGRFLIT